METLIIQRRTITIDPKKAKSKLKWRIAKIRLPRKKKKKLGYKWKNYLYFGWMMINNET